MGRPRAVKRSHGTFSPQFDPNTGNGVAGRTSTVPEVPPTSGSLFQKNREFQAVCTVFGAGWSCDFWHTTFGSPFSTYFARLCFVPAAALGRQAQRFALPAAHHKPPSPASVSGMRADQWACFRLDKPAARIPAARPSPVHRQPESYSVPAFSHRPSRQACVRADDQVWRNLEKRSRKSRRRRGFRASPFLSSDDKLWRRK
jgi:hypothetical protein